MWLYVQKYGCLTNGVASDFLKIIFTQNAHMVHIIN